MKRVRPRELIARALGPHCSYGELAQVSIEQVLADEGHEYVPHPTLVKHAQLHDAFQKCWLSPTA